LDAGRAWLAVVGTQRDQNRVTEIEERIAMMRSMALEDDRRIAYERLQAQQRGKIAQAQAVRERQQGIRTAELERIVFLRRQGKYQDALALAREASLRYPDDKVVEELYRQIEDLAVDQRTQDFEERRAYLEEEAYRQVEELMLPTNLDGRPVFPDDWDRRVERAAVMVETVQVPAWQRNLEERLAQSISLQLDNVPGSEALDLIARQANINMAVSPEIRLADQTVNLRLVSVRVDNVLQWVCEQLDTRWALIDGAVYVGEDRSAEVVTQPYIVESLLYQPPDLPGVTLSNFTVDGGAEFQLPEEENEDIAIEDLIDLMQEVVSPDRWGDEGWGITVAQNRILVVSADVSTHAAVREFLRQQTSVHQAQVRFNLNWLTVTDNYLEEIGVDWQNTGDVLVPPTFGGYRDAQSEWGVVAGILNALPEAAVDAARTNLTTGMRLNVMHLGRQQINAIFTAIQNKQKGRLVEGTELTVLNGSRANVFMGSQISYISDYEATGGGGDGDISVPDPTVETLNYGLALDVTPFIDASRQYVTTDLRPIASDVSFIVEQIFFPYTVNGFVFSSEFPLEIPLITIKEGGTRVMIPDRGTVLVGGLDRGIEQNSESGVPMLSHIPFVGRLFGKRGRYSLRESLYLSVTARIILNDEEEALQ
jgi:type II secretory pathway component GspD/PulD (secretin)